VTEFTNLLVRVEP